MSRIIIYGAGAIGCVIGGHLFRSGQDVVLIGRPAHVQAIQTKGLHFVTAVGVFDLRIPAVAAPEQIALRADDVVFLCMKGQDTAQALADLKKVADDVAVFCFQNGVRNEELASSHFRRVYGVMVHVGGTYLSPGEVIAHRDPPGTTILGCYPRGEDATAQWVAARLHDAGFRTLVTDDIMPYKWGKLMGNLANAIGAATDGNDPGGRIAKAVRVEARALLAEAGITPISLEDAQQRFPELATPDRAGSRAPGHGSTWQSLARGEGTVETEFLNGEIVRLAARLGKEAPLNAALVRIASEMAANGDKPGKYTPDELARELGVS
jgi:2-dehydropantoate 2-reductase